MTDFIYGHVEYWVVLTLLVLGLYGMIIKTNLLKKLIGLTIFQTSIILFFISGSVKGTATVPIITEKLPTEEIANYLNPLPSVLMLTAIVVGVATLGLAFAMLTMIHKSYGTIDETELLERMK